MSKKIVLFFLLYLSSTVVLSAKSPLLDSVDVYLFENSVKANYFLGKLNERWEILSNEEKGMYFSSYGILQALQGNNPASIRAFYSAYKLAPAYSNSQGSSLKNMANVYKGLANYDKSLSLLFRARKIYQKIGNKREEVIVMGEISSIYYYQLKWEQAISTNLWVIRQLKVMDDPRFLAIQYQRLANTYFSLDRYQKAIDIYQKSKDFYDKNPSDILNQGYICIALGDAYQGLNQYEIAASYYCKAMNKLASRDVSKFNLSLGKLGMAQWHLKKYKEASENIRIALKAVLQEQHPDAASMLAYLLRMSDPIKNRKEIEYYIKEIQVMKSSGVVFNEMDWFSLQDILLDYYQKTKQSGKLIQKLMYIRELDKQMNIAYQRERTERILERENYKLQKAQNKELASRLDYYAALQWIWILSSAFILALSGFLFYYYRARAKGQKLQNLKLKLDNFDLEERLELETKNVLLEKELQQLKERELAALSLQFYQLQDSIKADIKELEQKSNDPLVSQLNKKFQQNLKQKDYWKEFEMKFVQVNPMFQSKLAKTFPILTKKEIDFCTLVSLNLSNKEIATLTRISHESVISKKYKLRKKLGFQADSEWIDFLQSI